MYFLPLLTESSPKGWRGSNLIGQTRRKKEHICPPLSLFLPSLWPVYRMKLFSQGSHILCFHMLCTEKLLAVLCIKGQRHSLELSRVLALHSSPTPASSRKHLWIRTQRQFLEAGLQVHLLLSPFRLLVVNTVPSRSQRCPHPKSPNLQICYLTQQKELCRRD